MTQTAVTIVAHDVAGVGGMERQLRALISGLLDRGHHVTVVSRTLGLPAHERLRWRRVRGPARPFVLAYPWFALLGSLLVDRRGEGVLHTTGAIVVNRADVCTLHFLHNGQGGRVTRARRRTALYRLNERVGAVMARAFERLVIDGPLRARKLVAVSEALAAELTTAFPHRADDMLVIRNGVDCNHFAPDADLRATVRRSLGLRDDDFTALFVGSEWRAKGLALSLAALSQVDNAHLVVVGSGDVTEMAARAAALDVADRVRFVGETSEPERFYAAADAFVLPSEYESFSLAAYEAAATGLPIVATDVGAIDELLASGAGVAVERSPASVARALDALRRDESARLEMGIRGRALAKRYDWQATVSQYMNLYRSVRSVTDGRP